VSVMAHLHLHTLLHTLRVLWKAGAKWPNMVTFHRPFSMDCFLKNEKECAYAESSVLR
jgi:hypothetical protein